MPSPRLGRDVDDQTVWDSFVVTQGGRMGAEYAQPCPMPDVPSGRTIRDVIADLLRREHARSHGVDCAALDTDQMLRLSQYNLFPNATVLVWGEMVNVLVARPGRDARRRGADDVPAVPRAPPAHRARNPSTSRFPPTPTSAPC